MLFCARWTRWDWASTHKFNLKFGIKETPVTSKASLLANHAVRAATIPLEYVDVPAEKTISGNPRVGTAVLGQIGDCTVGVWEISVGVSTDVESNEFFIVLSGDGTITFSDGSADMHLKPGSVGHLREGAATTWTVTQTLRKIYIA